MVLNLIISYRCEIIRVITKYIYFSDKTRIFLLWGLRQGRSFCEQNSPFHSLKKRIDINLLKKYIEKNESLYILKYVLVVFSL